MCLLVGIVKDLLDLVVRLDESVDTREICTTFSQSYSLMIRFRPLSIAIDCQRRTNVASPVGSLQHLDAQVLVDLADYLDCVADCEIGILDAISFRVSLPRLSSAAFVFVSMESRCSWLVHGLLRGLFLVGRSYRESLEEKE